MADEEHAQEDKTEAASHKRLSQAREEGNVPIGRDAVAFGGLAGGCVALVVLAPNLRDSLVRLIVTSAASLERGRPGELVPLLMRPAAFAMFIVAAGAVGAAVAAVAQTGGGFWPELALPDAKRLFSPGKIGKLVKKETLLDLFFQAVKFVTVAWVIWTTLRGDFFALPRLLQASPGALLTGLFRPLGGALVKVLTTLAFLAGLELALTRYRHLQKMKMTKEESKREYKDEEGDPLFRGKRKRMHRDLLKGIAKTEVPKADALLVNPTHIAIALKYEPGKDRAPRVTAKGKGVLAETMRDLARQHGIPIVEDIPLARLLYRKVKIGRVVPAETFKAVAAILAYVYKILGRDMNRLSGGGR